MTKKEIDYYPEIANRFKSYLKSFLGDNFQIAFSYNKSLRSLITDIETELNCRTCFHGEYVPNLLLDILMGVKNIPHDRISLVLLEVKYSLNLSLKDFSQLVGYLQVAKSIKVGILFLVSKSPGSSTLSNELSDILNTGSLPLEWRVVLNELGKDRDYAFKAGICYYQPGDGIDFIDPHHRRGFSSFDNLADFIKEDLNR
jgi:hypothetical protein